MTHTHRRTCPTPHTQSLQQTNSYSHSLYDTHTETDLPNTTHSLSPVDRQLLGIPAITHTQTDGPAQHHTLNLSSRLTATRSSSYDTRTNRRTCPTPHTHCQADRQLLGVPRMTHTYTDGPAQHHALTLSSKLTATQHSSYDTRTDRRTCPTPHTHSLQQIDGYRYSSYDTHT